MAVASSIIAASIIAGASTGTAVYAAKKQGEAQSDATNAQVQAGHEALDFEKEQLQRQQELDAEKLAYEREQQLKLEANQRQLATQLSPFVTVGAGALKNLSGLANVAPPSVGATHSVGVSMPVSGNIGPGLLSTPMNVGPSAASSPALNLRGGSLSTLAPNPAAFQSGYTLMAAPDGSGIRRVPSDQVERLKALGATEVQ